MGICPAHDGAAERLRCYSSSKYFGPAVESGFSMIYTGKIFYKLKEYEIKEAISQQITNIFHPTLSKVQMKSCGNSVLPDQSSKVRYSLARTNYAG